MVGRVIVRTRLDSEISAAMRFHTSSDVVVAYEADDLDPQRQLGWSMVVTELATTLTDPSRSPAMNSYCIRG
jgi:hypothetical protein